MPKVFKFFNNLLDISLPTWLENIISNKAHFICDELSNESDYDKMMKCSIICITPEQIMAIYDIINRNENIFIQKDRNDINKNEYE